MQKPVLIDENGGPVGALNSASILLWHSGKNELQTEPNVLPDDFPLDKYSGPGAPPLYLSDGEHKYAVVVVGGRLELAQNFTEP